MMNIELTVAVRNPEWYWPAEQLKENKDYYKEWQALNEDKVGKHVQEDKCIIQAKEIREDRKGIYPLRFKNTVTGEIDIIEIEDVTVIRYINGEEQRDFVISNAILHQYIGAQQRGKKYYTYFYIRENVTYERVDPFVWLSVPAYAKVQVKLHGH